MSYDEPPMMSQEERPPTHYPIWIWLVPLIAVLGLIIYLAAGGKSPPATTRTSEARLTTESGVETARQSLARQTDMNACRNALQQINTEIGDKPTLHPPSLTDEQKTWLHDHLNLSDEELKELETSHYTHLDQHYLFRCLLMRDAAGALEIKGVRGKAGGAGVHEKPLDEAARAFAWVMREVRLRQRTGEEVPPSFVVRRGWGDALERALVFLALLEQIGDPDAAQPELLGFLLQVPNDSGGMRLWACGVVVGDSKEVYLFDPHLGLPLPGPNGEGIATLAQARTQPKVLAQLNVEDKLRYPVTAEQARAAQAVLVCPLSALSPRLRYLQDKLLAPVVRVRLAADAASNLQRIKTACSTGADKPASVIVSRDLCTLLSRFLPADEGGTDTTLRMARFSLDLVPWKALPSGFLDESIFPPKTELGSRLRNRFAGFFYFPTMEPGQPRDLMLRGRYSSAVPLLVRERDQWTSQLVQRANAVDLEQKVDQWVERATREYADLYRAKGAQARQAAQKKVQELWDDRVFWPIGILLNSAAAKARNPEVAYELGLCSQEQAEQLQARLDLETQAGVTPYPSDVEKAKADWRNARNAWKRFEEDYPRHRDRAAARRLRGRAEAMLDDPVAAIASWKNVADCPTELEKIGSLYLAQQWQKHPAPKTPEDGKR